jgi:hypothetical protein
MTTIALIASGLNNSRLLGWLAGVGRRFTDFFAGIEEARELATRYERLSRLSDAELGQLGLERGDIPRVVIFGKA